MSLAVDTHPTVPSSQPWRPAWRAAAGTATPEHKLLQQVFAAGALSPATLGGLLRAVQRHDLPPGPCRLPVAAQAPSWWLVAAGQVLVGKAAADGALVASRRVPAGQWLDVASAWSGRGWLEAVVCRTPATLWALPLQALTAHCADDPALLHAMGRVMADRVRQLTEGCQELVTKDVTARLASWLLRQLPAQDGSPVEIRLVEEKRSIACQLAMAKETLSRCFRRLVELGCIEIRGYRVTVLDRRGLEGVAGVAAP